VELAIDERKSKWHYGNGREANRLLRPSRYSSVRSISSAARSLLPRRQSKKVRFDARSTIMPVRSETWFPGLPDFDSIEELKKAEQEAYDNMEWAVVWEVMSEEQVRDWDRELERNQKRECKRSRCEKATIWSVNWNRNLRARRGLPRLWIDTGSDRRETAESPQISPGTRLDGTRACATPPVLSMKDVPKVLRRRSALKDLRGG